ncbi:hypothetical protein BJV82DRAFT_597129 [Fennellomyces sp. T-0311]|nr:hypothetical protein BJV82DRAFT_597129 [Fennellomyces sp. T-0311]
MNRIPESQLRDVSPQELSELFDDLFNETTQWVSDSEQWPTRSQTRGVTVKQMPRIGNEQQYKVLQRSSLHSDVSYDELRELLFVNHSLNETKYVELMVEAKEILALPSNHNGAAGVYWLGFKATLASSREFIELVVTNERKDEKSGLREFMVVSKPIKTSSPPVRNYTRGRYEAWERVRETDDGKVEWVCIQRSDPGGWIPRCLSDWVIAKEFHKDVQFVVEYICKNRSSTKITNKQ